MARCDGQENQIRLMRPFRLKPPATPPP
jgi:hypothetical protein